MRFNKVFLVGLFLLAILTIGAVSASDNNLTSQDLSLTENDEGIISDYEDDFDDEFDDDFDDDFDDGDDEDFWDEFAISWEANGDIYYLDNDTLIATLQLPQDATGELEVWRDGTFFANFPLTEGYVAITLGDLKFKNQTGNHYLVFTYAEGDYYVEDLGGDINIVDYEFRTPRDSTLGEKVTYLIDFHKNINGTLEFSEEIIDEFELTETFYRKFNVTDGKVNITLSDLRLGRHDFFFNFEDENNTFHLHDEFWVYPPINVKDKVVIGQDSFFTLNLASNASGEVMFTLYDEGEDMEDEFDIYYEDGEFEIRSGGLLPGNYQIISFTLIDEEWGKFCWEDSPGYGEEAAFISFKAVYPTNALIIANNLKLTYGEGKTYKVKVTVGTKAVEDARVVFKINGKVVKRTTTDEDGYASFKISKNPGTYKLTIVALGKTTTKSLTVDHVVKLAKINIRKSAKKLVLTATLAKVNGKYLKYKNVTFKFNGKTYKRQTNSRGIAKVTIPKTVLSKLKIGKKITYQATYMKDTVKKTAKVSI